MNNQKTVNNNAPDFRMFLAIEHPDSYDIMYGMFILKSNPHLVINNGWDYACDIKENIPYSAEQVLISEYGYERQAAIDALATYLRNKGTKSLYLEAHPELAPAYNYLCGIRGLPDSIVDRLFLEKILWLDSDNIVISDYHGGYTETYNLIDPYANPVVTSVVTDEPYYWYIVDGDQTEPAEIYICATIIDALKLMDTTMVHDKRCAYVSIGCNEFEARLRSAIKDARSGNCSVILAANGDVGERCALLYPDLPRFVVGGSGAAS